MSANYTNFHEWKSRNKLLSEVNRDKYEPYSYEEFNRERTRRDAK